MDCSERKFSGRSRLYIGNINPGSTEESLQQELSKFGEFSDMFYNPEKHFAFVKMDYRENAEKAKKELDGKMNNGRTMKVKFAPHQAALRIKNLGPWVSNELLHRLKSKGQRHPDYTRAVIKDKLNDTDNEIATTSCKVSLACPLGEPTPFCPPESVSFLKVFVATQI